MKQIQGLTTDALQTQTLSLPDGTQFSLQLYFRPMQFGWFITNLTYQSFTVEGLRVTTGPNFLFQFKNQIPFGIACLSSSGREPSLQADFASGASTLWVLSSAEVEQLAEFYSRGE